MIVRELLMQLKQREVGSKVSVFQGLVWCSSPRSPQCCDSLARTGRKVLWTSVNYFARLKLIWVTLVLNDVNILRLYVQVSGSGIIPG